MQKLSAIVRLVVLVAIVAAAIFAAWRSGLLQDPARAKAAVQSIRQARALPVWFVVIYTVTAAIGIPPAVLTLAGGALFGTTFGILYSWIGAVLGAVGGYAVAAGLGGNAIRHVLGRHRDKLDRLLERATFMALLRLRVNPIVPFNVLNFASGLSKVPFRQYFFGTLVGVLPAIAVYAYFADSVVAGATGARERAAWHVAIAGVVLLLLTYGPTLWRRATDRT